VLLKKKPERKRRDCSRGNKKFSGGRHRKRGERKERGAIADPRGQPKNPSRLLKKREETSEYKVVRKEDQGSGEGKKEEER